MELAGLKYRAIAFDSILVAEGRDSPTCSWFVIGDCQILKLISPNDSLSDSDDRFSDHRPWPGMETQKSAIARTQLLLQLFSHIVQLRLIATRELLRSRAL